MNDAFDRQRALKEQAMDGTRAARIVSAVSTLLLSPLRMTHPSLMAATWLLVAALLFVVLLAVHLVRSWHGGSRTNGRLVFRLFSRCMATAGPATLISLALAVPCYAKQHGLMLCESAGVVLAGLAFLIPMVFDCWKLAFFGETSGRS